MLFDAILALTLDIGHLPSGIKYLTPLCHLFTVRHKSVTIVTVERLTLRHVTVITPCDRILCILLHVVDTLKPLPYGYRTFPGVEMSQSHIVPGPGSPHALPTTRRCEGSQSSRWEQRPRRCSNMFEHV